MSYTDMAISLGTYKENKYDANKDGINEYNKVTNAESGATVFEDFDFDQNGAIDYRRGTAETTSGECFYEEFFNNDVNNNQKIYKEEPSFFEKALRALGIETDTTFSDIDKEEIRNQANDLEKEYLENKNKEEDAQAQLNELMDELAKVQEAIATEICANYPDLTAEETSGDYTNIGNSASEEPSGAYAELAKRKTELDKKMNEFQEKAIKISQESHKSVRENNVLE